MTQRFLKVLCVADYFLPGFKGGGPIRTLANLCELLAEDLAVSIFTRDRDLGGMASYPGLPTNRWLLSKFGRIFYATPDIFSFAGLRTFASQSEYDILYLNSFWSYRGSISVYLDWRRSSRNAAVLIAPRGEFSSGALALKRVKKRIYLTMARIFGLYRDVHWHASSELEATQILRIFPFAEGRIHIAADPISLGQAGDTPHEFPVKVPGSLKIAFISRISPMKNLDGLIDVLSGVRRKIELSIFGPVEDANYWRKCLGLIGELPGSINVVYRGAVEPSKIPATFAAHDIFVFPTRGENFGHVIFEALRAGTPTLVSDRTPWEGSSCGALDVIPLDAIDEWRRKIEEAADRPQQEQDSLRRAALEYARIYASSDTARSDNLAMFHAVARSS